MNIAIFASGAGTNARNIIAKFKDERVVVKIIVTNNPEAGVIRVAQEYKIPFFLISNKRDDESIALINALVQNNIELIVLAGYLKKIGLALLKKYPKRIINIHPALLPKYGGIGMYGMVVHQKVVQNRETETGITIHYVNENYDEGELILQKSIKVEPDDTPESVAIKVHALEYTYYPIVIESLIESKQIF